jgi:hypothetical protein
MKLERSLVDVAVVPPVLVRQDAANVAERQIVAEHPVRLGHKSGAGVLGNPGECGSRQLKQLGKHRLKRLNVQINHPAGRLAQAGGQGAKHGPRVQPVGRKPHVGNVPF